MKKALFPALMALFLITTSLRASMVLQSLTGPVTPTEVSSFESFMVGQSPPSGQTYDNTIADGSAGMQAEALGLMYEVTNDPVLLNKMIVYADQFLSLRNDFTDRRVMWDGRVDPVWLTKAATDPAAGYAGCENNDIVGHIAYCARLILQTPSLWSSTVPDGNPHGYGVTYYQRALTYIAQMEVVQSNYMVLYFIDSGTHRITAPTSSAWTSLNENTTAWNRQMMFMNGFQRLSECHQILGDNPANVALYDSVVSAAMSWFFSGLSPYTASGQPVYNWTYCPTCGGSEDNTLHSTYDIWGSTRAYTSGRYGVTWATMVPFANTLEYVMTVATNTISYYVNGTDGSNGTRNFIYPGWMPIANFGPVSYYICAKIDSSRQASTAEYDAMILSVKNSRYLGVFPTNNSGADFTVATPWTETLYSGASSNCTVTVNSLNGFSGTVNLGIGNLPGGVTASFNPASISGSGTSTLTLTAAGSNPSAIYALQNALVVTATSGSATRTAPITLVVTNAAVPDFTLTAAPSSQTVVATGNTTYTATVTALNGFSGNVALTVSGLPTGANANYNPASVSGSGSSTLRVTTTNTTPAGGYTLTLTGTSGSLVHTTTVTLIVSDFTISETPASRTVIAGNSTNYSVNVGSANGFNGSVSLTASGLPSGASANFNPTSVTTPGASTMTVSTSGSTPPGTNALTITGTSGSLVHNTTATLVVSGVPDFSVSASPSSQTVIAGNNTTYTATAAAINGFGGTVTWSVSGLPTGASGNFSPSSVNGSGSSTLTVTTSTSTPLGTNTLTITGTSGSLVHTTTVTLVVNPVPDFSVSATPSSQTVTAGNNTTYTSTASAINGFNGTVTWSVSGLPTGASGNFNPATVTGSGSSTLTVTTSTTTPAGTNTLTITGTSGSLVHNTTVTLVVNPAPDFSVSATPSSQTVTAGNNATCTATATATNGFSGTVTWSVSGLPTGASGSFNPTSVNGSGSSTLTITTTNTMPASTNTLTITGTSGSLQHSATVTLIINPIVLNWTTINDTDPGITYSVGWNYSTNRGDGDYNNDVHYTKTNGNYAQYTFAGTGVEYITETYSDEGNVDIYIDGTLQTTVNCNSSTRQAQVVMYSNIGLSAGSHTIKIVKNGGTYALLDAFAYVSAPVPNFTVSASPSSQTVTAGNNTSYTATITPVNGFSGTVNLSVSGLPSGASGSFNPTSVTGSGSSTLTVTTSTSTAAGTYTLTITGISGNLTNSTTAALVVNAAPDFSLSASPSTQTVTAGANTTYTATTTALNGFNGNVSFTVSGLPSGSGASFNPSSVMGSGSSTLTITTTNTMTASTNTLTITGTSGSLQHSTTVTLIVNPAAWTLVNDTDSGITYSSGWNYSSGRGYGDYQDDIHYTKTNANYAQYTFTGTSVEYITETYSDEGNVDVYIDGALQTTVNCTSSTRQAQVIMYSNASLAYGSHTIKIVKNSGTYMLLDAFGYR
jgi:uncharacterized protein (DUF58 family)